MVFGTSTGAGYGLFAIRPIAASTPLFAIPPKALLNSLTLAPHYPPCKPKLTCTQIVTLHLLLHRPVNGRPSSDPLFGPYISVLPTDFDSHPLTWLWKKEHGSSISPEAQLIEVLPPRILEKLDKMANLFEVDWNVVKAYLQANATSVLLARPASNDPNALERDYLWAWLNTNTRCVYHRLMKTRSSPDNMTLCPILDFANHTANSPHTMPKPTNGEIWDTGPLGKKTGEQFILLAPSTAPTAVGDEIYLRYEVTFSEELELQGPIESLFKGRGEIGQWMKECLIAEGYWGNWTLHSTPKPAHPSYRLITSFRLYHILPLSANTVPANSEQLLNRWRDTTLGKQPCISTENEILWRKTLLELCQSVLSEGEAGIEKIQRVEDDNGNTRTWFEAAKGSIEMLWREETRVAAATIRSLEDNEEF
ncbi:hypothetical protein HYPSUDRAFT_169164 [Hypholoma sublateritium FD-334 SS-4]|uniref:SET domain-containing protein n=1 Tax=Hypholoma sublateritium (strain FD-334 SS-4) TaxID=945553 RepID=A0A0D2NPB4_HYPSF|nr:hypothetical protein HYPSUDRAFT_169164 [Hypholoma sublateritium FD-334 SS-4]